MPFTVILTTFSRGFRSCLWAVGRMPTSARALDVVSAGEQGAGWKGAGCERLISMGSASDRSQHVEHELSRRERGGASESHR